jgi:methyl-accepting chemotaxis protein
MLAPEFRKIPITRRAVRAMAQNVSVVRPLMTLRARMAALSAGELDLPVADTDRQDEIGEMARTVDVFKAAMVESNRLRTDQRDSEAHEQARRRSDLIRLSNEFEAAIGEIVTTVSSASGELETSANTLTATAVHSQQLASTVAAASAEASNNVQAVASASEQMTSSVNEISRQVQESARIAHDAVDQAKNTTDQVAELSQAAGRIGAVGRQRHHAGEFEHRRSAARRRQNRNRILQGAVSGAIAVP